MFLPPLFPTPMTFTWLEANDPYPFETINCPSIDASPLLLYIRDQRLIS